MKAPKKERLGDMLMEGMKELEVILRAALQREPALFVSRATRPAA